MQNILFFYSSYEIDNESDAREILSKYLWGFSYFYLVYINCIISNGREKIIQYKVFIA